MQRILTVVAKSNLSLFLEVLDSMPVTGKHFQLCCKTVRTMFLVSLSHLGTYQRHIRIINNVLPHMKTLES